MVTQYHTTVSAQYINDGLRHRGRCRVRLSGTHIEFEVARRGIEVVTENMRHVMYQEYRPELDRVMFSVTVGGRWECRVWQEGFDGLSKFEVLDKAGDDLLEPLPPSMQHYLTSPTRERSRKLLLCLAA